VGWVTPVGGCHSPAVAPPVALEMPLRQAQLHPEIPGSSGHDAGYGPAGTFFR